MIRRWGVWRRYFSPSMWPESNYPISSPVWLISASLQKFIYPVQARISDKREDLQIVDKLRKRDKQVLVAVCWTFRCTCGGNFVKAMDVWEKWYGYICFTFPNVLVPLKLVPKGRSIGLATGNEHNCSWQQPEWVGRFQRDARPDNSWKKR